MGFLKGLPPRVSDVASLRLSQTHGGAIKGCSDSGSTIGRLSVVAQPKALAPCSSRGCSFGSSCRDSCDSNRCPVSHLGDLGCGVSPSQKRDTLIIELLLVLQL